jgi:sugar/nucleoside kinase (ribokinase family)
VKRGHDFNDQKKSHAWLAEVKNPVLVPGGSACNTIVGLSKLGARALLLQRLGMMS